jgi:hypothetical protein
MRRSTKPEASKTMRKTLGMPARREKAVEYVQPRNKEQEY